MIAVSHRMLNTVVNRCKLPADGDIIVPIRTVAVIGTTDVHVPDPDVYGITPEEVALMLRPLRVFQEWLREGAEQGCWRRGLHVESAAFRLWLSMHGLCSMLNSGRIDEKHPAFPFADQETFVAHFIADTVNTLRTDVAA